MTDVLAITTQNENRCGGLNFWATPTNFSKIAYLLEIFKSHYCHFSKIFHLTDLEKCLLALALIHGALIKCTNRHTCQNSVVISFQVCKTYVQQLWHFISLLCANVLCPSYKHKFYESMLSRVFCHLFKNFLAKPSRLCSFIDISVTQIQNFRVF